MANNNNLSVPEMNYNEINEKIKNTLDDILDRAKKSRFLDFLNGFIPFVNLRTLGKKPLDMELHEILVLLMEADKEITKGQSKAHEEIGKLKNIIQNDDNDKDDQTKFKEFMSALLNGFLPMLEEQMKESKSNKKPKLVKLLNNLARKYGYEYRITKVDTGKKDDNGQTIYELKVLPKEQKHSFLNKANYSGINKFDSIDAFETGQRKVKRNSKIIAAFLVFFIAVGSGGLTTAAALALPFSLPMALIVSIFICGTYVNYKLFISFVVPFMTRFWKKGIVDTLFGEGADLNLFKKMWNFNYFEESLKKDSQLLSVLKWATRIGLVLSGVAIAGLVLGLSTIVAYATVSAVLATAVSFTVGAPILFGIAVVAAVATGVATFLVYLPTTLHVLSSAWPTFKTLCGTMIELIQGDAKTKEAHAKTIIDYSGKNKAWIGRALVLGEKIIKAGVMLILMGLLAVPIALLFVANVLTIVSFQKSTVALLGFAAATYAAILAIPGQVLMGINGFFSTVTSLLKTVAGAGKSIVKFFSSKDPDSADENKTHTNPWNSLWNKVINILSFSTDLWAIGVNAVGNGLIAASGSTKPIVNAFSGGAATLSSAASCSLGFLGEEKAVVHDISLVNFEHPKKEQKEDAPVAAVQEQEQEGGSAPPANSEVRGQGGSSAADQEQEQIEFPAVDSEKQVKEESPPADQGQSQQDVQREKDVPVKSWIRNSVFNYGVPAVNETPVLIVETNPPLSARAGYGNQ